MITSTSTFKKILMGTDSGKSQSQDLTYIYWLMLVLNILTTYQVQGCQFIENHPHSNKKIKKPSFVDF